MHLPVGSLVIKLFTETELSITTGQKRFKVGKASLTSSHFRGESEAQSYWSALFVQLGSSKGARSLVSSFSFKKWEQLKWKKLRSDLASLLLYVLRSFKRVSLMKRCFLPSSVYEVGCLLKLSCLNHCSNIPSLASLTPFSSELVPRLEAIWGEPLSSVSQMPTLSKFQFTLHFE